MDRKPSEIPGGHSDESGASSRSDGTTTASNTVEPEAGSKDRVSTTPFDSPPASTIWAEAKESIQSKPSSVGRLGRFAESPYTVEQRAQARIEWELGVKNPAQIARELGIGGRTTIYTWAKEEKWRPRGSAQVAIRESIDSEVIRQTADALRARARSPDTGDEDELAERLAAYGLDADETAPSGQQIVKEYALAATEVIRRHQEQAADACEIGDELLAMFKASSKRLRHHFELLPGTKKDGTMGRMDLISKTAGQFATLVRALQIAHRMQREAMALDRPAAGEDAQNGDAPAAGQPAQPGSYEEVVMEMEAKRRSNGLS